MSTIVIPIDATPADAQVAGRTNVRVNDTVQWTVSPETARATVAFRFPACVRMVRATADQSQPAEAIVLAKPGRNEDLKYDLVVSDPAWPTSKPATAELIIAIEISGPNSQSLS